MWIFNEVVKCKILKDGERETALKPVDWLFKGVLYHQGSY